MMSLQPSRGPLRLRDFLQGVGEQGNGPRDGGELHALARLEAAGLAVAPARVVSAEEEERFYRLNNLPRRLSELFQDIDLKDPDEDEVEEVAPEAEALIKTHFLLDEFIDLFYLALEDLPAALLLRRPGERDGLQASRGRPALLALKNLWAAEWRFEGVMERLEADASVALHARPVLIQPGRSEAAPASLAAEAAAVLGREVGLLWHPDLGITHALPSRGLL